jgi:transcriptional regulator with GAF, ATPase, and Fis domain
MHEPDFDVAQRLAAMARNLLSQNDVASTLERACQLAAGVVDGCEHAGVWQVQRGGDIETAAASNTLLYHIATVENDLGEGPCRDALWHESVVHLEDTDAESRWPRYAARLAGDGVGSMLCFQLFVREDTLGVLSLVSGQASVFDEAARETGLMFASHAAIALAGAQSQSHLSQAVRSRQLIGEAVGLLADRYGMSTDAAFGLLARVSQECNTKVRELAARLVNDHNQAHARQPGGHGDIGGIPRLTD